MTSDVHCRYKETRLSLEPVSPSSAILVRVGPASSRSSSHRSNGQASSTDGDERAWRAKNIATAASIYRRKHHNSPQSFLWRVLENDTILSIRTADVCKQQKEPDATLTLNLSFPAAIRTSCIGFADPAEHDALTVFVVDQANTLHSITLRPEAFWKRSALDGGLGEACKSYSPPGFGFKHPHRLIAVSSDQLIVTMHDGGILRFDRNRSQEANSGSVWKETIYNVAGWGQSLRGLVPFQRNPTVRYEKINMEMTAATSTAITSMGRGDTSFLFTVCVDHRMRVWEVRTGQILYTGDILNKTRNPQDDGRWVIEPSQSNLIRILDISPGQSLVVTFSPVGAGEFKLWSVKANDQGSILVHDLFPNDRLIPPAPNPLEVWTLADFGVAQQGPGPELWTMWKNNTTYRVQTLQVLPKDNEDPWSDGWKGVRVENALPLAQSSSTCDPTDSSERWLSEIFFPGRFTKSTLETALAIYEKGLIGSTKDHSSKSGRTLAESICSVVGSTTTLEKNSVGGMDYEQFRGNSEFHWRRFYRFLGDLDKQRGEALSLVMEPEVGMIWVVCADCVAAIRQCSRLELVCHNLNAPEKSSEGVAALVQAGLTFLETFSDGMWQLSRAALQSELFEDSAKTDDERLQYFSDKAGFWRQVTEEDCATVIETLGPNFNVVTPRLYEDLFDLVRATSDENSQELQQAFTKFGGKLVVRTVQEASELSWQILFSQLILLVHMEFEFDNEEDALHSRFNVGLIYGQIINALRRLEHIKWMTKTEMSLPTTKERSGSIASGNSPNSSKRGGDEPQVITVLEALVGHLLGLSDSESQNLLSSITSVVTNLCAPDSDIEFIPHLQQCFLLKADRADLALELAPFSPHDPFSTYVQGRVCLALNDCDSAELYFRKAAIGLSNSMAQLERHSSRLLDETEWNLLNSGLPNYYLHIVNLFEKQKAYSFVAVFARLALQFADVNGPGGLTIKTELQSRLFTASTATSHFDVAHTTLLSMKDEALQKSCLRRLVEKMCDTGQNKQLVMLPFSSLQEKVDDILFEKCRMTRDVVGGVPYHQILYAWRVYHNDHRGAAAILLDRLQKLRQTGEGDRPGGDDALDTQVTRQYLLLINTLSCVESSQAFILEDLQNGQELANGHHAGAKDLASVADGKGVDNRLQQLAQAIARHPERKEPARKVVTLGDLRKQYQDELDRIVAIQNDQYAYTPAEDDEMDIG